MRLSGGQELSCGAFAGDVDAFTGLQQQQAGSELSSSGGAAPASSQAAGGGIGGLPGWESAVTRAVAVTDGPLQVEGLVAFAQ